MNTEDEIATVETAMSKLGFNTFEQLKAWCIAQVVEQIKDDLYGVAEYGLKPLRTEEDVALFLSEWKLSELCPH